MMSFSSFRLFSFLSANTGISSFALVGNEQGGHACSISHLKLLNAHKLRDLLSGFFVHFLKAQLDYFLEIFLKFIECFRLRMGPWDSRHNRHIEPTLRVFLDISRYSNHFLIPAGRSRNSNCPIRSSRYEIPLVTSISPDSCSLDHERNCGKSNNLWIFCLTDYPPPPPPPYNRLCTIDESAKDHPEAGRDHHQGTEADIGLCARAGRRYLLCRAETLRFCGRQVLIPVSQIGRMTMRRGSNPTLWPVLVNTSTRGGGLKCEPLKADCCEPPVAAVGQPRASGPASQPFSCFRSVSFSPAISRRTTGATTRQ